MPIPAVVSAVFSTVTPRSRWAPQSASPPPGLTPGCTSSGDAPQTRRRGWPGQPRPKRCKLGAVRAKSRKLNLPADRAAARNDHRLFGAPPIAGLGLHVLTNRALGDEFEAGVDVRRADKAARHLEREHLHHRI